MSNNPLPHQFNHDTASVVKSIDSAWSHSPVSHPLAGVIQTAYQEELN